MAINPLLPILIGAIQTRNVIKDQNEAEYDEITGAFIDAAATEFLADKAEQKKRIEKNNNFYKATEGRYGTNVAEFAAKNNLFEGYNSTLDFLRAIEEGQAIPLEFRNQLRDDKFFKTQGFKTTFAEDTNLAKQKLEDKTLFAAKNLNKGAVSNLADLYLGTTTEKPSKLKSFLFGQKTPDVTAMAAGFEKGLEDTAEKSVVKPEETTSVADASSLAADTNLIDQKLGFEKTIGIGSVREVDSAIASIFNIKGNVQLTSDGVIFPSAFKLRALAVKDIAADFAQSGKYSDVTTLIGDAANYIEQEYFSKLPMVFGMYEVKSDVTQPVVATATFAIDQNTNTTTLGNAFEKLFNKYVDDKETADVVEKFKPEDLVLKREITEMTTKRGKEQTARSETLIMSPVAYNALKGYIQDMESVSLQKAFIEYLPVNLSVTVGDDNVLPIKARLNATFGFTTF